MPQLPLKVWRRKIADEFAAHLCISTGCEIHTRHQRTNIEDIYGHIIEIYHRRLDDQEMHPRRLDGSTDPEWSDAYIVSKFSMFQTREEWNEWNADPLHSGMSLSTKSLTNSTVQQSYLTFSKALWAKFGRFKTHIINVVNVDFKKLLENGKKVKSGWQIPDVVELLRRQYFDEWSTTTEGAITHAPRNIEECVGWVRALQLISKSCYFMVDIRNFF